MTFQLAVRSIRTSLQFVPSKSLSAMIPLPTTGGIEGNTGVNGLYFLSLMRCKRPKMFFAAYTCDYANNDCHLIVVDTANKKIYESYLTTSDATNVYSTCLIIWDMCKIYPADLGLRGDQCTRYCLRVHAHSFMHMRHMNMHIHTHAHAHTHIHIHAHAHAHAPSLSALIADIVNGCFFPMCVLADHFIGTNGLISYTDMIIIHTQAHPCTNTC